jgi:hypothetical protein
VEGGKTDNRKTKKLKGESSKLKAESMTGGKQKTENQDISESDSWTKEKKVKVQSSKLKVGTSTT